jgi:hypothetical protein
MLGQAAGIAVKETHMRKKLALLAVLVVGVASPVVAVPVASAAPAQSAKTCSASYVHANLPWGEKCLRAGEFCKVGNAAYLRFGFTCPTSGHLRRR